MILIKKKGIVKGDSQWVLIAIE